MSYRKKGKDNRLYRGSKKRKTEGYCAYIVNHLPEVRFVNLERKHRIVKVNLYMVGPIGSFPIYRKHIIKRTAVRIGKYYNIKVGQVALVDEIHVEISVAANLGTTFWSTIEVLGTLNNIGIRI